MNRKRKNSVSIGDSRSGSLERNNVYSADAVRDWAWRIRSGAGGIKMNQKFMLVAMATSCNPRGICEMPVRYLADHIGVGMRQGQRIILQLNKLELITFIDLIPQGRPIDIVRKFALNTGIDADTWTPNCLLYDIKRQMQRIERQAFFDLLTPHFSSPTEQHDLMRFSGIDIIGVRSKQLDFVATDQEVTKAAFRHQKLLMEIASTLTKSPVIRIHMIPRKGYRS